MVLITAIAALVVFSIVQDRVTAAGANRYAALQREALAGHGRAITVDEVMRPAIRSSVRQGVFWGGGVMILGLSAAGVVSRRGRSA